nr:hypothetical protein Itr_chr03CG01700 [Ipomoea trifida]
MTTDDACYFADIFHKHVESVYPNLVGNLRKDSLLRVLDDNDGLESFTFDDNSLLNEHANDLHEILCGDDVMHVDANMCDLNDVEFVNFFDDCLDDAYMPRRTRSKAQAKKRKQDVGGTSRGGVEGESDLVAPGGRGLGHLNADQRARVEELQSRAVSGGGGFYFDFPLLDSYGCREEVERMTSQRYWEHLFSWRDDTYEPVVHEFIATFEPMASSHQCTPSMRFTVFGQQYKLSVIQLGRYLGFYTQDDIYTDEYQKLPWD